MLDVGKPAPRGLVTFLPARGFGARFADRFERDARRLVGFGEFGFGRGEPIGRGAPVGRRLLNGANQRLAFGGEFLRRIFEFRTFRSRFLRALIQRGDLRRRIVAALAPGLPLGCDGL